MISINPVAPEEGEPQEAAVALAQVQGYLDRHPGAAIVELSGDPEGSGETLVVPRSAVTLLSQVLAHLSNGRPVSVVPADAELTTQQAADMLNVSRPYLVGLLEAGEISHRKVGTRRRVRYQDLVDYQKVDDDRRRKAVDDLTHLSADLGIEY